MHYWTGIAVLVGVLTVAGSASAQCKDDRDCRAGRVCKKGRCVEAACTKDVDCPNSGVCEEGVCKAAAPPPAAPPVVTPTPPPAASPPPPAANEPRNEGRPVLDRAARQARLADVAGSLVGIQVDVGGFVFYGPAVSVEVGSHLAFGVEARAVGFGAVTQATAGQNTTSSASDFGVGATVRYYFGQMAHREGLYLGGAVEYVSVTNNYKGSIVTVEWPAKELLMGVNAGYRWVFPNRMTLGTGLVAGYMHVLSATSVFPAGEDAQSLLQNGYGNGTSDGPGGLLTMELGYAL